MVDLGGGTTVTLDDTGVTHTVFDLTVAEDLVIANGILDITTTSSFTGNLLLTGGAIQFSGDANLNDVVIDGGNLSSFADTTVAGTTSWLSGNLLGSGNFFAQGPMDVANAAGVNLDSSLQIAGLTTLSGAGDIGGLGDISILSGGTLDHTSTASTTVTPAVTVANGGTLRKSGSGAQAIFNVPTASGTIANTQAGTTLALTGGGQYTGASLESSAGAFVAFNGGDYSVNSTSQIVGPGPIQLQ